MYNEIRPVRQIEKLNTSFTDNAALHAFVTYDKNRYTYSDLNQDTTRFQKSKEEYLLALQVVVDVVVVFLTSTDPLRIQPWSQDRRFQTKSNRESEISRESRQKRTDKKLASKGHRRGKIENKNKNTQTVDTN